MKNAQRRSHLNNYLRQSGIGQRIEVSEKLRGAKSRAIDLAAVALLCSLLLSLNVAHAVPPDSAAPAKYLELVGVKNVVVIDEFGHRSDRYEDLEELDAYISSIADDVVQIALGTDIDYTILFETTEGVSLEFTVGIGNQDPPSQAVRYLDVDIPSGVNAILQSPAEGIGLEWLRYDADGDGDFESIVQPTAEVTGDAAKDITPPNILMEAREQVSKSIITLSADDSESGVKNIYYSLDGMSYQVYTEPFAVDPGQHPVIYAFADDNVANRSRIFGFKLKDS